MKKPDWFNLIEEDKQDPYVNSKVPFGVMFTILIAVTAIIFLFPSKTAGTNPTPTVEIIQTPLDPITMPTTSPEEEEDEAHDEDSED
jgi:hypothetical protein